VEVRAPRLSRMALASSDGSRTWQAGAEIGMPDSDQPGAHQSLRERVDRSGGRTGETVVAAVSFSLTTSQY
jgi:hypothetical protein